MKKLVFLFLCCMASLAIGTGGAWAAEFCVSNAADLQAKLSAAPSEDNVIMVVQGKYKGNFTYNSSSGKSLTLQGGYTAKCAGRVLNPANTVLDGNHAGGVLNLRDYNGGNISVEGFTIQNGNTTGSGGGVFAYSESNSGTGGPINLTGNTFTGNTADFGGGVRAFSYAGIGSGSGEISLYENTIKGNYAYFGGGGVFATSNPGTGTGGAIVLSANTITGNYSYTQGGGVWAESDSPSGTGSDIVLLENTITGNYAYSNGGGGVFAYSDAGSGTAGAITLTNNTISGNTAYGQFQGGAGVYTYAYTDSGTGGAITLTGNTVANNHMYGPGGGLYCSLNTSTGTTGTVTFEANTITGNISHESYGGVYARAYSYSSGTTGPITFTNNIIAANTSEEVGGAYAYAYSSVTTGAITFTDNTITKNSALYDTGGLEVYITNNTFNCYNNIIRGNTAPSPADLNLPSGSGTAYGYNNDYHDMSGSWNGGSGGNIDADPLFDAGGHYHLTPGSPCIDAGDNSPPGGLPATDIDGNSRVIGAAVDIGAVEYNGPLIAKAPDDGTVFADGSLINKYQPTFQWIAVEPFNSFEILFSTYKNFSTVIATGSVPGTTSSWTPPIATWKKVMAAGAITPIYWVVVGTGANNSKTQTPVRQFSVSSASPPTILSPADGATLPVVPCPTFVFSTNYNIKFRLEISPVSNFIDPKQILAYTYTVANPNVTLVLQETLSSSQWTAVEKLIENYTGYNTGYFRIRAWDGINRESDSPTQSFTIQ